MNTYINKNKLIKLNSNLKKLEKEQRENIASNKDKAEINEIKKKLFYKVSQLKPGSLKGS